jgi:hypothetical protein
MSSEMLKMRQQLEYLQAELFARGGCSSDEVQVLDYANVYLRCSVNHKNKLMYRLCAKESSGWSFLCTQSTLQEFCVSFLITIHVGS